MISVLSTAFLSILSSVSALVSAFVSLLVSDFTFSESDVVFFSEVVPASLESVVFSSAALFCTTLPLWLEDEPDSVVELPAESSFFSSEELVFCTLDELELITAVFDSLFDTELLLATELEDSLFISLVLAFTS